MKSPEHIFGEFTESEGYDKHNDKWCFTNEEVLKLIKNAMDAGEAQAPLSSSISDKFLVARMLTTDVQNILSMVSCAEQYGHGNQIFYHFAANVLEFLDKDTCDAYVREVMRDPRYGEEDQEEIQSALYRFLGQSFDKNGDAI